MSAKKSETKAESHASGSCPNCGYCPHCGRSNPQPIAPWPYQPWVHPQYPRPYWQWIPSQTYYSGSVTARGGLEMTNAISAASVASSN